MSNVAGRKGVGVGVVRSGISVADSGMSVADVVDISKSAEISVSAGVSVADRENAGADLFYTALGWQTTQLVVRRRPVE